MDDYNKAVKKELNEEEMAVWKRISRRDQIKLKAYRDMLKQDSTHEETYELARHFLNKDYGVEVIPDEDWL